jgi:zinc protease
MKTRKPMKKTKPTTTPKRQSSAKLLPALQRIADNVTEASLPNGLQIRLLPSKTVPTCSYYTFFKVGSRNEQQGLTGISHLFEHMMFNGAKKYGPGKFDRLLESNGGSSNAYTSNDLTVYYEDFMSEALDVVIDLESDRMRSLAVAPKMLESERKVVMEERRLRVDNEPMGLLDEELSSLVWRAHPYRWPVIGHMKDIENIGRDDCLQYFKTFYAPNNATIVVSGDFEVEVVLKSIREHYGSIRKGPPVPAVLDAEPAQLGERRSEVRYPAQAPSMMVAFRGPKADTDETLALDVLQYALSVGQSSRLTRRLVLEREVAVSASVDYSWRIDNGAFVVALELKPGGNVKEAEAALFEVLAQVAEQGLTDTEIQKAKNNLTTHFFRELATNNGRAHALGTYEMMLGHWRKGLELPGRYAALSPDFIRTVAARYLAPSQRSVVTLVPTAQEAA